MISTMRNLTVRLFERLEITSVMDIDKIIKYTEYILKQSLLNKNRKVLAECKKSEKGASGYQWTIGLSKGYSMEQLWT